MTKKDINNNNVGSKKAQKSKIIDDEDEDEDEDHVEDYDDSDDGNDSEEE